MESKGKGGPQESAGGEGVRSEDIEKGGKRGTKAHDYL